MAEPFPPGTMGVMEYAKKRGVHSAQIYRAIQIGSLEGCYFLDMYGRKCVIVEKADAVLDNPTVKQQMSLERKQEAEKTIKEMSEAQKAELVEKVTEQKKKASYTEARTGNEFIKLQMAKLQLEEKKGTLVSAAQVEEDVYQMARVLREQILSVPDRVASQFAAERDDRKIHRELMNELRQALAKTEDLIRAYAAKKSETA